MTRFVGMHRLALLLALAGCPTPGRYIVTDVTAARAPLPGALVAADCGTPYHPTQRTDEDGRARVRVVDRERCSLLIAKPGYPTVLTGPVDVCPAGTCAPTRVDLGSGARPMEVAQ
jgi:hypothetical protein